MTKIRMAESGNGMGTTTSGIEHVSLGVQKIAKRNIQRSCGITSDVLCKIVYLRRTVSGVNMAPTCRHTE